METQQVPLKLYRTADRITVAAPMPGLDPDDVAVDVAPDGRLTLRGGLRGVLKDEKEVLRDEWNPGPYAREVALPAPVDGRLANVTYRNGVVVVLPVAERTSPAHLTLEALGPGQGERVGHVGRGIDPTTTAAHQHAKQTAAARAGGTRRSGR